MVTSIAATLQRSFERTSETTGLGFRVVSGEFREYIMQGLYRDYIFMFPTKSQQVWGLGLIVKGLKRLKLRVWSWQTLCDLKIIRIYCREEGNIFRDFIPLFPTKDQLAYP